jgi:hemerythrin
VELIQWSDKYCIGNEEIDNHHRLLFKTFHCLYNSCAAMSAADYYEKYVADLVCYANCHFRVEELHMIQIGYADIQRHRAEHALFKTHVSALNRNKSDYGVEQMQELILFLGDWLLNHVINEDGKLAKPPEKGVHVEAEGTCQRGFFAVFDHGD